MRRTGAPFNELGSGRLASPSNGVLGAGESTVRCDDQDDERNSSGVGGMLPGQVDATGLTLPLTTGDHCIDDAAKPAASQ